MLLSTGKVDQWNTVDSAPVMKTELSGRRDGIVRNAVV